MRRTLEHNETLHCGSVLLRHEAHRDVAWHVMVRFATRRVLLPKEAHHSMGMMVPFAQPYLVGRNPIGSIGCPCLRISKCSSVRLVPLEPIVAIC